MVLLCRIPAAIRALDEGAGCVRGRPNLITRIGECYTGFGRRKREASGDDDQAKRERGMINLRSLQIRRMQADDPSALATVFADMNKSRVQFERYWQENIDGRRVTLVALLDGRVVGYTNVIWESDYESFRQQGIPEVNDMNTVTPLRGKGIGTRMLQAAEEPVRQKGMRFIGIGVGVTPDYAIAQKLYPNLGYVSDGTGVHPDKWGGSIYYVKDLRQETKHP